MQIDIWKIPQETYTTSWNQKRINKESGVRPGFSDAMVFLPSEKTGRKSGALLFIEMKRQRKILKNGKIGSSPSSVSESQKDFLQKIDTVTNAQGRICYGAEEATQFIESFLI